MGVDTRITLNPGARVRDVGTVMAIATGADWEKRYLGQWHPGAWYPHMPSLEVKGIETLPECAWIEWDCPLVDHRCSVLYHHEWGEGEPGASGLLPRSTPFWIAVAHRLVTFFGGSIDYNDSDDVDVDFTAPTKHRHAEDGEPWQAFQAAMTAVERIDRDTLLTFNDDAYYKLASR